MKTGRGVLFDLRICFFSCPSFSWLMDFLSYRLVRPDGAGHSKRDYVSCMDLTDAQTVLAQLPAAFEHFNEVHPHSSLKMRSPREFRQHHAAKQRADDHKKSALYCV